VLAAFGASLIDAPQLAWANEARRPPAPPARAGPPPRRLARARPLHVNSLALRGLACGTRPLACRDAFEGRTVSSLGGVRRALASHVRPCGTRQQARPRGPPRPTGPAAPGAESEVAPQVSDLHRRVARAGRSSAPRCWCRVRCASRPWWRSTLRRSSRAAPRRARAARTRRGSRAGPRRCTTPGTSSRASQRPRAPPPPLLRPQETPSA